MNTAVKKDTRDTDNQCRSKTTNSTGTKVKQNDTCDDRCQVRVEDSRECI